LQDFWRSRKKDSQITERDFSAWYKLAKNADWANFGALKQTFGTADLVGNCVVFDVGNNRFRLVCRVNYAKGIIYVLKPMDHEEYDRTPWADACGCHKPPPKKAAEESPSKREASSSPRGRKGRGER